MRRKRPSGPRQIDSTDMGQAESDGDTSGPSPKRVLGDTGKIIHVNTRRRAVDASVPVSRADAIGDEPQQKKNEAPEEPSLEVRPIVPVRPLATGTGLQEQTQKTATANKRTRVRPTPRKRAETKQKATPGQTSGPQASHQGMSPPSNKAASSDKLQVLPPKNQHEQSANVGPSPRGQTITSTGSSVRKRSHSTMSSPGNRSNSGNSNQQKFATRQEATVAFMMHVQTFARSFCTSPPRSERQFIWSFLKGIPDPAWAGFMQEKLLMTYPGSVRPSLGTRAKHSINFDAGLTWRHVLDVIRSLQQKPSA